MRQAGFEPTTFGSGGNTGQRPPTLAGVVSGTYADSAPASVGSRRHRCYHPSLLYSCLGAATPVTCLAGSTTRSRILVVMGVPSGPAVACIGDRRVAA